MLNACNATQSTGNSNQIILNAGSGALTYTPTQQSTYINPIRSTTNPTGAGIVCQDTTTNEIFISSTLTNSLGQLDPTIVTSSYSSYGALTSFNTTHSYNVSSTGTISLTTQMTTNAVYEILYHSYGSTSSDNQLYFLPSGATTADNFYTYYSQSASSSTTTLQTVNANFSGSTGFYMDFVGGSGGFDPIVSIKIFNITTAKRISFTGGDSAGAINGVGYWLTATFTPSSGSAPSYNTTTTWSTIGTIVVNGKTFSSIHAWVRRIG